ncbi:MAG TPA: hypothetical protein VEL07_03015 [Planctomycetota bacterium]|nr:hypothetical protein [Planctomycetota bacterium]
MYLLGHSFGGYAVQGLVMQTDRFTAAASISGYCNLVSLYGQLRPSYRFMPDAHGDLFMQGYIEPLRRAWGHRSGTYSASAPAANVITPSAPRTAPARRRVSRRPGRAHAEEDGRVPRGDARVRRRRAIKPNLGDNERMVDELLDAQRDGLPAAWYANASAKAAATAR